MAAFIDNCGFIPTAAGTSDWTYSSTVGGYQSPSQANALNGTVYVVRAQSSDLTQWEYASGAYSAATNTFARTTVLYNSAGSGTRQGGAGSKIAFSTVPSIVAVVAMAEDLISVEAANSFTDVQRAQALANLGVPFNCGRLSYVSATALKFVPYNGDLIKIGGIVYRVPYAGIAGLANTGVSVNGVAGQSLAANTLYYIYLFSNGGTLTADFSTTGHQISGAAGNIGVETKNGDDTRALIGMVYANASAQFMDNLTATWFNRRLRTVSSPITSPSSPGSYFQEVGGSSVLTASGTRAYFLVWGDEGSAAIQVSSSLYIATSGAFNAGIQAGVDGVGCGPTLTPFIDNANHNNGTGVGAANALAEGLHYGTYLGGHNAGSGPTYGNAQTIVTVRN